MKTIFRVPNRHSYAIIDRRLLEDSRLSWAARGILTYLLVKPDDWELNITNLRNNGDLGRDALSKILKQLESNGYLVRRQGRDRKGRMICNVYEIHEQPIVQQPETDIPVTDNPKSENPVQPNNTSTKDPIQITTTTQSQHEGGGEFEFPKTLTKSERYKATELLQGFSISLAQSLLDELAGIMAADAIRLGPIPCLRGLIKKARQGEFSMELGLRFHEARIRRSQIRAREENQQQAQAVSLPVPPDNELTRRVVSIARRRGAKE